MTPDLFFSMLDFGWVTRQITDGNPIPFLLWTAFIAALGFVAGRWWKGHDDERQIDRRLGKIDEFSRVRTLSDLMEKADELSQSASAEVMVERTQRIAELETRVARQALEIDERRAENSKLKEIIESTGIDELENLRRENADLKNELTIVQSSAWYEKHKEGMASKQARGRFSIILPKEAEIIRSLYDEGTMSMLRIEPRTLHSMKDKGLIVECTATSPFSSDLSVRLSDQMTKDLNKHMDVFTEAFGL